MHKVLGSVQAAEFGAPDSPVKGVSHMVGDEHPNSKKVSVGPSAVRYAYLLFSLPFGLCPDARGNQ